MMISICSYLYDPTGDLIIRSIAQSSNLMDLSRRVSRSATLDGDAAFSDYGYTESDRSMSVDCLDMSKEDSDLLAGIVKTQTRITVSTPEAVFLCAPDKLRVYAERTQLSVLVVAKLNG